MMLKTKSVACWLALATLATVSLTPTWTRAAAANQDSPAEKERQLISVLQSDAPPQDKAVPCKLLAVYGTKNAVPALAALLPDERLSSWARIALEAIPDRAADDALREALGKLQGRLLIGVINSVGVRRDAKAVVALVTKLNATDAEVASAAAVALGRIGGNEASKALERALTSAPPGARSAVAEGCILCAEGSLNEGKAGAAAKLYDTVRKADVPKQRVLEATRGAILARGSAGLPLLLEQLRSPDKALFGMGLTTARELPGKEVTAGLAAELNRSRPDRQAPLLLAISDRKDDAVMPAIIGAAKSGPTTLRLAAVRALDRSGTAAGVPALLDAAADRDADLAKTARAALIRLPGKELDTELLARLPQAAGKQRQVLIEVAGQRKTVGALPLIVRCAEDADAGVRAAAVEALGAMGEDKQTADLVRLMQKTPGAKERADLERALLALSSRCGTACVPYLLPLAQTGDAPTRMIALHALAGVGGPEALAAIKAAIDDKEEAVQDEAVRTLSTWPDNWPEDSGAAEPLLRLAKSGKKTAHQVLGLRGYLQHLHGDKKLQDGEKLTKVSDLLTLMQRPEEKRLAITVLGTLSSPGVLEMLLALAADPASAEDAYAAIADLARKNAPAISAQERQKALQAVVAASQNEATKKKAEEALKRSQ